MFKVMFVVYENKDIPREKALEYWRTQHAEIVRKVPGVTKYVQSHAVAAPGEEIPFLGIAELCFADEAAFGAAAGGPEFGAAVADLANFGDPSQLPTAFMEDHVIV